MSRYRLHPASDTLVVHAPAADQSRRGVDRPWQVIRTRDIGGHLRLTDADVRFGGWVEACVVALPDVRESITALIVDAGSVWVDVAERTVHHRPTGTGLTASAARVLAAELLAAARWLEGS